MKNSTYDEVPEWEQYVNDGCPDVWDEDDEPTLVSYNNNDYLDMGIPFPTDLNPYEERKEQRRRKWYILFYYNKHGWDDDIDYVDWDSLYTTKILIWNEDKLAKEQELFKIDSSNNQTFLVKPMISDGRCLFRSLASKAYNNHQKHDIMRLSIASYIVENLNEFLFPQPTIIVNNEECKCTVEELLQDKFDNSKHWGGPEDIVAFSKLFEYNVIIYSPIPGKKKKIKRTSCFTNELFSKTVRLFFKNGNHYDLLKIV